MKRLFITILLLLTFNSTTYANVIDSSGKEREPLKTTDCYLYTTDEIKANIDNLKKHTVIVMLQKDGLAYRGAGIAIDKRHILTVDHGAATTEGSNNYYFSEENGKPYDAKVIKNDPTHDQALLEIERNAPDLLDPMTFNSPIAGEIIYTIGHPLSGVYSLTKGEVGNSAGRLEIIINAGNSGGFVMNQQGELVGMITSKQEQVGNMAFMTNEKDIQNFIK